MFAPFADIRIRNRQPGFQRLVDIVPGLRLLKGLLGTLDRVTDRMWGFYQVIEARKPSGTRR
jgi:hypothetical protein